MCSATSSGDVRQYRNRSPISHPARTLRQLTRRHLAGREAPHPRRHLHYECAPYTPRKDSKPAVAAAPLAFADPVPARSDVCPPTSAPRSQRGPLQTSEQHAPQGSVESLQIGFASQSKHEGRTGRTIAPVHVHNLPLAPSCAQLRAHHCTYQVRAARASQPTLPSTDEVTPALKCGPIHLRRDLVCTHAGMRGRALFAPLAGGVKSLSLRFSVGRSSQSCSPPTTLELDPLRTSPPS